MVMWFYLMYITAVLLSTYGPDEHQRTRCPLSTWFLSALRGQSRFTVFTLWLVHVYLYTWMWPQCLTVIEILYIMSLTSLCIQICAHSLLESLLLIWGWWHHFTLYRKQGKYHLWQLLRNHAGCVGVWGYECRINKHSHQLTCPLNIWTGGGRTHTYGEHGNTAQKSPHDPWGFEIRTFLWDDWCFIVTLQTIMYIWSGWSGLVLVFLQSSKHNIKAWLNQHVMLYAIQ